MVPMDPEIIVLETISLKDSRNYITGYYISDIPLCILVRNPGYSLRNNVYPLGSKD
jgi:hypothetical protein